MAVRASGKVSYRFLENGLLFLPGEEASAEECLIAAEAYLERRGILRRLKRAVMLLTPLQRATL